jgi:ubiquinone/menaquinone biosynthesis C-methylase UbiE
MAVNNVLHTNEYGLPLNTTEWLKTHHQSKMYEREQMIQDLGIEQGNFVVDAGCGPGLWTPLLIKAVGPTGRILGVDISTASLIAAQERAVKTYYHQQVQYKLATLEQLPLHYGEADLIFSANVSQYLPDPVATFATIGPYLKQGGQLVVKDMDLGTMHFHNVNPDLQARVFEARIRWDQERVGYGYSFEDSWIGSKLAGYLRAAGYKNVQEKSYRIERSFPLSKNCRFYLQGIADWFVSEGNPYLSHDDKANWLQCFSDSSSCVLDLENFAYEECEYVVSGIWTAPPAHS